MESGLPDVPEHAWDLIAVVSAVITILKDDLDGCSLIIDLEAISSITSLHTHHVHRGHHQGAVLHCHGIWTAVIQGMHPGPQSSSELDNTEAGGLDAGADRLDAGGQCLDGHLATGLDGQLADKAALFVTLRSAEVILRLLVHHFRTLCLGLELIIGHRVVFAVVVAPL